MNYKYLLKNLILRPMNCWGEFSSDIKKDFFLRKNNSKSNLVWICGLPKSGTTLIEQILDNLLYIRIDRSFLRKFPKKDNISPTNINDYIYSFPKKKFSYVKTHLKYDQNILKKFINERFKVIVVLRDIRDVMISRYFHVMSDNKNWQHDVIKTLSFEEGFIKSLHTITEKYNKKRSEATGFQKNPLVSYYYWIKNWKQIKESENLKKVWYEDYIKNPHKFIKEILDFTEFNHFDEKEIEKKLNFIRQRDKKIPLIKQLNRPGQNVSTFRSGKAGEWKSLFNERIEKEFNNLLPDKIEDILN
ncbi:MAG: hypothetical protein CMA25_04055 [Euryarchaeota archaeon]|nr:hypothetical protein [Euryarchaeota archaeon]